MVTRNVNRMTTREPCGHRVAGPVEREISGDVGRPIAGLTGCREWKGQAAFTEMIDPDKHTVTTRLGS
jgi:hypothetical protein